MKGNMKLGLVLAIFAAVGCASLAVVYSITESAIAAQSQRALSDSLKEIFPDSTGFEDISATLGSGSDGVKF
jgi:Na+-translocating ferredoxin:NAD+ oxidoreductase RnfG subunit